MNTLLLSTSLLIASFVGQADSFQSSTELVGSRRGAAAFAFDPAAVGIAEGMELRLSGQVLPGETSKTTGTFALVLPWESLTLALGADWLDGAEDELSNQRSTLGLAFRLGERISLGAAWRRWESDGVETLSVDVGLYAEVTDWLALSILGQHLNEPVFANYTQGAVYGVGLGLRPVAGAPWLTLGSQAMFLRKPGRPLDKTFMTNVAAYAAVEFWQGLFARVAWHYNKDGTQEIWAGLGLNTSLGSIGVETELSMGLGADDGFSATSSLDRSHWAVTLKERGEPGLEFSSKRARTWISGTTRRKAQTFLGRDEAVSTLTLRLAAIAKDDSVDELILGVSDLNMGLAGVEELRAAIQRVRDSGKQVTAYLSGGDEKSYLVALAANSIKVDPVGILLLDGFSVTARYFSGALDKAGIRFDAVAVGDYKTGPDSLIRSASRPEDREVRGEILDEAIALLKQSLAKDRNLSSQQVDAILKQGYFHGEAAVQAGLADGLFTEKEADQLPEKIPNGWALESFERADPYWGAQSRVAIIPILGNIVGQSGGSPLPGSSAAAENIIPAIEAAASDSLIEAVVLRIDSPGGDVMASERIWRAVRRLAERKPVVVSMGQVAASGGYYIAAPAHAIFAEPNSITGSIGVFALIPDISGLYEMFGIGTEIEKRGEQADWNSETIALRDNDRAALTKALEHYYSVFIDRVAQGRNMKPERVREIAGGRVYTGNKARQLGLVDQFGGLLEAVEAAANKAGLAPNRYVVEFSERALGKRSLIDLVSASREENTVTRAWEYIESVRKLSRLPLALMPQWYEVDP